MTANSCIDFLHFLFMFQEAEIQQQLDPRIVNFIRQQVAEGVRNVKEVRRHIKSYVCKDLFKDQTPPSQNNRRFFPTKRNIRNHIYLATIRLRFSKIDQDNLEHKIKEWERENPSDKFFFRKYSNAKPSSVIEKDLARSKDTDEFETVEDVKIDQSASENRLLFIHQTAWQRRLLERYGNELSLLDATYKTIRYSLPLFFLVIKTNIDYQVVASFVLQDETSYSISEALNIVGSWCEKWIPGYFMVDNSNEEINAINSLFPGMYSSLNVRPVHLLFIGTFSFNAPSENKPEIKAKPVIFNCYTIIFSNYN